MSFPAPPPTVERERSRQLECVCVETESWGAWRLASLIFLILLWVSAPGHEPAKNLAVHPSPWGYVGTRLLYENGGAHCLWR